MPRPAAGAGRGCARLQPLSRAPAPAPASSGLLTARGGSHQAAKRQQPCPGPAPCPKEAAPSCLWHALYCGAPSPAPAAALSGSLAGLGRVKGRVLPTEGGGMRPAATSRFSLTRKLKVAQALSYERGERGQGGALLPACSSLACEASPGREHQAFPLPQCSGHLSPEGTQLPAQGWVRAPPARAAQRSCTPVPCPAPPPQCPAAASPSGRQGPPAPSGHLCPAPGFLHERSQLAPATGREAGWGGVGLTHLLSGERGQQWGPAGLCAGPAHITKG